MTATFSQFDSSFGHVPETTAVPPDSPYFCEDVINLIYPCALCHGTDHQYFHCTRYTNHELVVISHYDHAVYVMWRDDWTTATIGDIHNFVLYSTGLEENQMELYLGTSRLPTQRSFRCFSVSVHAGMILHLFAGSKTRIPRDKCFTCHKLLTSLAACESRTAGMLASVKDLRLEIHRMKQETAQEVDEEIARDAPPAQTPTDTTKATEPLRRQRSQSAIEDGVRELPAPASSPVDADLDPAAARSPSVAHPDKAVTPRPHRWADSSFENTDSPAISQLSPVPVREPTTQCTAADVIVSEVSISESAPQDKIHAKKRRGGRRHKRRAAKTETTPQQQEQPVRTAEMTPTTAQVSHQPELPDPDCTVHIRYIPVDVVKSEFLKFLSEFGAVIKVRLMVRYSTEAAASRRYQFGFVEFANSEAAQRCVEASGFGMGSGLRLAINVAKSPILDTDASDAVVQHGAVVVPCTFGLARGSPAAFRTPTVKKRDSPHTPSDAPRETWAERIRLFPTTPAAKRTPMICSPALSDSCSDSALIEQLNAAREKRREAMADVNGNPATKWQAEMNVAHRAAQLYLHSPTSSAYHTAHTATLSAFTLAGRSCTNALKTRVFLAALYVKHGEHGEAVKTAYDAFAADYGRPSRTTLNNLLTIAMLFESTGDMMLARLFYQKVQTKALPAQNPSVDSTLAIPDGTLLSKVLPGVTDLATLILCARVNFQNALF